DRGARVTHRLLRDHPEKVTRGATLDIVPKLYRFETIDQKAATGSWHWFFLIQGRGLPEHMIGRDPEFFLRHMFGTLLHDEGDLGPGAKLVDPRHKHGPQLASLRLAKSLRNRAHRLPPFIEAR
ncbi:MAG: hypothetical protein JOZ11_17715, partial [Alphaproteobacteria bacterium]|nr:hypothetical protein [Alphaproteobacteria bacterium]